MGAINADGGWFGPGDDLERAWDEAEAILLASEDLDAVMEVIREAESPVEARRALKFGFGFTGRQAALLLTLPVMSFTRSERRRLDDGRRARMDLLADVTGVLPAIRATDSYSDSGSTIEPAPAPAPASESASESESAPAPTLEFAPEPTPAAPRWDTAQRDTTQWDTTRWDTGPADAWNTDFGAAFDGVLAGISSAMEEPAIVAPPLLAAPPAPEQDPPAFTEQSVSDAARPPVVPVQVVDEVPTVVESARPIRRSLSARQDTSAVLDEQVGELCDAIAMVVGVAPPTGAWSDDPRSPADQSGALLDSCGVDDHTGIRTFLWHLRRTGLDALEGLFPFSEPLTASQGFDAQSVRFESAMAAGGIGSGPGADVLWASRLWPIAERRGFGYAVAFGSGPDAGSVWAYGGDEPLHRLWDSVVDLLVELYQSLTTGSACDAAVGAVLDGRVVWTNLS